MDLPAPINRAEKYAWQQCRLLVEQNVLLQALLDRLSAVVDDDGGSGSTQSWREVREPQPAPPPLPDVVEVREPASLPVPEEKPTPEQPDGPAPVQEQGAVSGPELVLPEPPPRAGRGSGLDVWQQWADLARVTYGEDARRDDIIAACIKAGVLAP